MLSPTLRADMGRNTRKFHCGLMVLLHVAAFAILWMGLHDKKQDLPVLAATFAEARHTKERLLLSSIEDIE